MGRIQTDSHLTEQQVQGRLSLDKATCEWCVSKYDKTLSDATNPNIYCSQRCEKEDLYLPDGKERR